MTKEKLEQGNAIQYDLDALAYLEKRVGLVEPVTLPTGAVKPLLTIDYTVPEPIKSQVRRHIDRLLKAHIKTER